MDANMNLYTFTLKMGVNVACLFNAVTLQKAQEYLGEIIGHSMLSVCVCLCVCVRLSVGWCTGHVMECHLLNNDIGLTAWIVLYSSWLKLLSFWITVNFSCYIKSLFLFKKL